jgi:hypothetical protein
MIGVPHCGQKSSFDAQQIVQNELSITRPFVELTAEGQNSGYEKGQKREYGSHLVLPQTIGKSVGE